MFYRQGIPFPNEIHVVLVTVRVEGNEAGSGKVLDIRPFTLKNHRKYLPVYERFKFWKEQQKIVATAVRRRLTEELSDLLRYSEFQLWYYVRPQRSAMVSSGRFGQPPQLVHNVLDVDHRIQHFELLLSSKCFTSLLALNISFQTWRQADM